MITTVNHKIIECDSCKETKEFSSSLPAPDGWWKINFNKCGITYHSFDFCPKCTDKVKNFIEDMNYMDGEKK